MSIFPLWVADMRYLPLVTIVLWLATVLGYVLVPHIILLPQVKFPLIILMSILIPVCFWVLQKDGKLFSAGIFIVIFLFNIGLPAYGAWQNDTRRDALAEYIPEGMDPQMAQLLTNGESLEERKMAAQILFEQFGVKLPYLGESGEFLLYSPSKTNKANYVSNHDKYYRARLAKDNLEYQNQSIFIIIALQFVLFLSLLVFLVLYDNKEE